MDEPTYRGGGFSRSNGYPGPMSDALVQRLARQELEEQREAAIEERMVAQMRADWEQRQAQAAGLLAEQRGEVVSARDVLRGWVGRTKAEALAYHSAQMDLEDAQQMARLRRQFRHWDDDAIHAEMSADNTPPTLEELAAIQANRESARAAERAKERARKERLQAAQRMRTIAREEILVDQFAREERIDRVLGAVRSLQGDAPLMHRVVGERGWS